MVIHLLGTGGADGVPALCSDSRVSQHARLHGGKDVRSRSSALVDGLIKIDLGPDTWWQVTREGIDARDWAAVFFTHADPDHLAVEEIQYFLYPFNGADWAGVALYGNNLVLAMIADRYPDWPIETVLTKSFCPVACLDYRVTPIRAHHGAKGEDAHNLIVEREGKSVLYATDTGVWHEPTWEFLQDVRLDCLILECTEGFSETSYDGHLDIREFRSVIDRLRRQGTLGPQTLVVTTHHSHNGGATHAELEAELGPDGVVVGFDGLKVEI